MNCVLRWFRCLCAALALAMVIGCIDPDKTRHTEKLVLARAHLRAERYLSALSLLQDIPYTEENTSELRLMQALAYFKLEDYPHATTAIEQIHPQSPGLQIMLAYLYLLVGNLERSSYMANSLSHEYGTLPEMVLLKGNISLMAREYQKAEHYFRTAITMDQTTFKAYIGLGHTALLQRRLGKAEEYYLHAVFLSPDEITPQLALVNFYRATQRYDDAEETLRITLARYRDNPILQMALVSLLIKTYRNHEATEILEEVLSSMTFSDDIKIFAIRQYFALQQLDKAYKLISQMLSSDSSNYYGLILYGEYLFRNGDYDLALNYFHKSLSKNPTSFISFYYISIIYLHKKNIRLATYFLQKSIISHPNSINAHLLMSIIYLQSHKYSIALDYLRSILEVYPGDLHAHLLSGIIFYLQGYHNSARYEFDVLDELDPENMVSKLWRALIELEEHHPMNAEKYVITLKADVTEKIFLQAQTLQEYGIENTQLQQQLDDYVNTNHASVAWLILGHVYYTRGDYVRAEVAYKHAMEAPHPNVLPYYAMSELEVRRQNRRQAIAYLEQAVIINPAFTKSYRALGSLYEQEKDYQRASITYEHGLQYAPDDPMLLNNLAWAYLMLGSDLGTAYMHIRKAITLAPEDLELQDTLAWWYYLTQDYLQAITLLNKIVKAQPDHALYRYHLGMAYLKSGHNEPARQHLQRALKLGIDADSRRLIEEHMR